MKQRIANALRRMGDKLLPLPDPNAYRNELAAHAAREAEHAECLAEVYELEAQKQRLHAATMRARAQRCSPPAGLDVRVGAA